MDEALDPHQPVESLTFDRDDLRTTYRKMNRMEKGEPIDTVALGCPFSSLDELREISRVLARQRVAPGVKLIVCTSRDTLVDARSQGYAGVIEEAGGHILSDICPGALGHARPRNYVSNSFKQAFYGRSARWPPAPGSCPWRVVSRRPSAGRWARSERETESFEGRKIVPGQGLGTGHGERDRLSVFGRSSIPPAGR